MLQNEMLSPAGPGVRRKRLAFILSTALASSASIVAHAAPATVNQTTSTDSTTLNTAIAAAADTPNPDVSVTIGSAAAITSVSPATSSTVYAGYTGTTGHGDGAISFTNAGTLGVVTAGSVTDAVSLELDPGAAAATNTASVTNTGTITGSVYATGFGGTVSISNGGTIYGDVNAEATGNVTVTTGAAGVVGGTVTADSYGNVTVSTAATGNTAGGVNTEAYYTAATPTPAGVTVYTGGNSEIDQTGNATALSGPGLGDLTSHADIGNSTVNLGGTAGNIYSTAGDYSASVTSVSAVAPQAGKTIVTDATASTYGAGTSTVDIAATGSASYVSSWGIGGSTVTVDGTVTTDGIDSTSHGVNRTTQYTTTEDTGGHIIATTYDRTRTAAGGASTVTVDATGKVTGDITSNGDAGSTVTVNGTDTGSVTSNSENHNTVLHQGNAFNAAGDALTYDYSHTHTKSGTAAVVTVGAAGSVSGDVTANGDGSAAVTVNGTVGGDVTANQQTGANDSHTENVTYDGTTATPTPANIVEDKTTYAYTYATGTSAVTVAANAQVSGDVYSYANGNASVTNSGTLGTSAGANGNVYVSAVPGDNTSGSSDTVNALTGQTVTTTADEATAGGAASFTNNTGGYVSGSVDVVGATGATVVNSGQVVGTTTVTAGGSDLAETHVVSSSTTTTSPTPPALAVTTVTDTNNRTYTLTSISANVTGTYAGTNGQVVDNPSDGSITQYASGTSTATVSGTVYGSVNSYAGTSAMQSSDLTGPSVLGNVTTDLSGKLVESTTSTVATDTAGNGTGTYAQSYTLTGSTVSGATSTVNVTGLVSNAEGTGSVYSEGNTASTVNVTGGTVMGDVTSNANGDFAVSGSATQNVSQVITAGTPITTASTETLTGSLVESGGAGAFSLTGNGTVGGSVEVDGVSSATATIAAGSTVGGSVGVYAGGTDMSGTVKYTYAFDPTATTLNNTATTTISYTTGTAAASGNASATVAGNVGSVDVEATGGNATANITGYVDGTVQAWALGSTTSYTDTAQYVWTAAGTGSMTPSLPPVAATETLTGSTTVTGGAATVTIDTPVTAQNDYSVNGNVVAIGVTGATVTVGAGSSVGGYVGAYSYFGINSPVSPGSGSTTYVPNTTGGVFNGSYTETYTATYGLVGAAATVTNNGEIDNGVGAHGTTAATVNNNGAIYGDVDASALNYTVTVSGVDNQYVSSGSVPSPSTHTITETKVYTPVGGTVTVTNAKGALIDGTVYIAGQSGTLNNSGTINYGVELGSSVPNGTVTYNQNSTTLPLGGGLLPSSIVAGPAFTQTYTLNQNGVLYDGVYVTGADYNYGVDPQTSTVIANINLNTGSVTYGNITADQDTVTTVNVNGGVLEGSVFGVTALNFLGSGVSTLNGSVYIPAGPVQPQPYWTASLKTSAGYGSVNVNNGIVQVTPFYYGSMTYGIDGNVSVGANGTLVLGTLNAASTGVGSSVTGEGETVNGANLLVSQNFTSTGTVKVGLNGSLVANSAGVISTISDFTAPVETVISAAGGLYTTPAASSLANISSASSLTVGGTLKLGGTVAVDITKGSIFTGTESQVLATAGAIDTSVSPTVVTNMTSPFVVFSVTTNAAKTEDDLTVTRKSYATVATNPNAAAAAVALDKTIPGVVSVLTKDAAGIRAYSTLTQYSNVQDLANIVANLDWNTSTAGAAEIMNELGTGSFYGSLANIHQNVAFDDQLGVVSGRRFDKTATGASLWMTPTGNFAKYDHGDSGAAKIDATSYGAAVGLDIAYKANAAFGIGFGYARHNVNSVDSNATADVNTYTFGTYWTQNFGKFYANAQFSYGFSVFDATRSLPALGARTASGHFRGNEWDGSIEIGGDVSKGAIEVTPYAKLALRHWHQNAFDEINAGAVGLSVAEAGKTVFDPSIGVRFSTELGNADTVSIRPFGQLAYTFQGDAGTVRTVRYEGDLNTADTFQVQGVDPKGYATVEAGVATELSKKIDLILGGSYGFGSGNNVGQIKGTLRFKL